MTPSDSDKQCQAVSPPPVLPASCHAAETLESKKRKARPGGFLASVFCAWLPPGMSVPSCECQQGTDPAAPRALFPGMCSSPPSCLSCVGVGACWEAATSAQSVTNLEFCAAPWSCACPGTQRLSTGALRVHFPKPGLLQEVLVRGQGLDQLSKARLELPCAWQAGRNHPQNGRNHSQCPLMVPTELGRSAGTR